MYSFLPTLIADAARVETFNATQRHTATPVNEASTVGCKAHERQTAQTMGSLSCAITLPAACRNGPIWHQLISKSSAAALPRAPQLQRGPPVLQVDNCIQQGQPYSGTLV